MFLPTPLFPKKKFVGTFIWLITLWVIGYDIEFRARFQVNSRREKERKKKSEIYPWKVGFGFGLLLVLALGCWSFDLCLSRMDDGIGGKEM